ncbi:MAG: vWA domain-containing protein, partial [Vibrio sp.]
MADLYGRLAEFHFMHPVWLWGIVPVLLFGVWLKRPAKQSRLLADHLSQALGMANTASSKLLGVLLSAWVIALVALASPSFEKQAVPSFNTGQSRVLIMDMSRSMYATDLTPNRLVQMRLKVLDLLPSFQEGVTGLVAYDLRAYTVSPLTKDSKTLANLVPNLSPEIMPYRGQGSDASKGIE